MADDGVVTWDGRPPGTAGEEAVLDVPRASPDAHAGEVRAALAGRRFVCATELAVTDGEHLVGVVGIEQLFAASDTRVVGELAHAPATVAPELDLEAVTRAAVRGGGRSVAVVDADGRFRGLVPAGRLLHVLELEHEEDLARLGGFLSGASVARMASEEVVLRRLWHRLPWLALGLLGAMALPYALARLGRDPAFGAGPLATVIQDLLSILAYFAIAVLLVT